MNGVNGRWLGKIRNLQLILPVYLLITRNFFINYTHGKIFHIFLYHFIGQPLNISAAYSGRIACAYKYGKSFTRPTKSDPDSRYVNLCVAIYECESTGGSEWILEDTIHLKNIHLPRIPVDQHLDLSYLYDSRFLQKKQRLTQVLQTLSHEDIRSPRNCENGESTKSNAGKIYIYDN